MRVSFDQNLWASLYLYGQYRLQQTLQAYQTLTTRLFPTEDPSLPAGWQGYSSPLKGWVYDSGVSGALIISSISGGGFSAPLTRASGIHIDYPNARVILPSTIVPTQPLTGTASFCEVNSYAPQESEETLLTQHKMFVNPCSVYTLATSGAPPNAYVTPAVFVNPLNTSNAAFQFGGTVDTKSTITMTVFAESPQQLAAVLGMWRDCRYQWVPLVDGLTDWPLDQWGDWKGGTGFNYVSLAQRAGTPGNLIYIENVTTARVSDKLKANTNQWIGIVDVDVCFVREPSVNLFA